MQTTKQTLYDGKRNTVMQFTGMSEGDNETLVLKVDTSLLLPVPATLKITNIQYEVVGGIVRLFWDHSISPVPFLDLASVNEINYEDIGGMVNSAGAGATGNILLSTLGFDSGSSYSIKLAMKKKF